MILHEYVEHGTIGRNGWYVQYVIANIGRQLLEGKDIELYSWLRQVFHQVHFRSMEYRYNLSIISIRAKDRKESVPDATRAETPDQIHQDQGQVQDGI